MLAGGTETFLPVSGSSPKLNVTVKVYLPGAGSSLKINLALSEKRYAPLNVESSEIESKEYAFIQIRGL